MLFKCFVCAGIQVRLSKRALTFPLHAGHSFWSRDVESAPFSSENQRAVVYKQTGRAKVDMICTYINNSSHSAL